MQTSCSFLCNPQLFLLLQLLPYLSITTLSSRSVLLSCLLLFSLSLDGHASAGQRSYNYSLFPPPPPSSHSPPSRSISNAKSNKPSTGWSLSDYDGTSGAKAAFSFRDFVICSNFSSDLGLLNEDEGLYGRCTGIVSAHGHLYPVSFALCFVTAASNKRSCSDGACYYVSLVARKSDPNDGQIIWTANTNRPVSENACLQLGNDSNLKLVEHHKDNRSSDIVWQTNTTGPGIGASLAINFEGNLVLFKSDSTTDTVARYVPIWESFQHPTDTLMVLQILQKPANLSLTRNTLSSQASSARAGAYTMVVEDRGLVLYARIGQVPQVLESSYGAAYWVWPNTSTAKPSSSSANEIGAAALCWDSVDGLRLVAYAAGSISPDLDILSEIPPENCSSDGAQFLGILNISDPNQLQPTNVTYATFLRLEADGDLHAYTTDATGTPWSSFYSLFDHSPCDLPLYCGFYGVCDRQKKDNRCACEAPFKFVDENKTELGCDLDLTSAQLPTNVSSLCSTTAGEDQMFPTRFLPMHNVHYFSLNFTEAQYNRTTTDQCQAKCRNVCNCTAAFWNERDHSCFLIQGQIGTIQKRGGMIAFIKYNVETAMRELQRPTNSSRRRMVVGSAVAATVFALAIAMLACFFLLYKRRTASNLTELENERLLLSLSDNHRMPQRFSWKQLQEYTCGFSDFLGGGGFGSVFRGSLPDGTAIAVKELDVDGSHGQGDREFIAEVSILSRTEHVHLVQLIGFCLEGKRRLLVYEYMENGSLDRWLFRGRSVEEPWSTTSNSTRKLSWRRRFAIAVGTSKGMAYLHEECKDKVIHMDLKPQNILLDRHFMPKISDFGISKRMSREKNTAMMMTVMRGTPGYLAPEWLLDFAVTEKCDVYSFGIVLLEMVSGRKVRDVSAWKGKLGMRSLAETVMVDVLDEDFKLDIDGGSDVKVEEAVRMVEVALLCVRKDPEKRPAMSSVALMLEGKANVAESAMDDCDDDDDVKDEDVRDLLKLAMRRSSTKKTMRSTLMPRNNNATSGEAKSNSSWNEEDESCSSNMLSSSDTKSS